MRKFGHWIARTFDDLLLKVLLRFNIRIRTPERNPFQAVVLLFIVVSSLLLFFKADTSSPSLQAIGEAGVFVNLVIAIGATISLFALMLRDREVGLAVEQWSHVVLCFGSWGYVFAVVGYNGLGSGVLTVGYTAGVAVGAWARACHILFFNRQIAVLTRGIDASPGE